MDEYRYSRMTHEVRVLCLIGRRTALYLIDFGSRKVDQVWLFVTGLLLCAPPTAFGDRTRREHSGDRRERGADRGWGSVRVLCCSWGCWHDGVSALLWKMELSATVKFSLDGDILSQAEGYIGLPHGTH